MWPPHLFTDQELRDIGFGSVGRNVRIDRSVRIFGAERIVVGDHVRIDPFCILSAGEGGLSIGRNVHIAAHCVLIAKERVELQDFSGISARVAIYTSNDDYSGGWLTGPTVPDAFRNVTNGPVILSKHVIVGAGSVILPGVTIGLAASIGALTLIRKDVPPFAIMGGNPARQIGSRSESILERERAFLQTENGA